MISRRQFLRYTGAVPVFGLFAGLPATAQDNHAPISRSLRPVGRALEREGYYVWCNSPIYGPDGTVHVFYSRWPAAKGMGGWLNGSEIVHATAPSPEEPFTDQAVVLNPRGAGYWDATTCHNPHIQKVGDHYALFFMGNANGKTDTKRMGLATAPSLNGPWLRPDKPLLEPGPAGAWDDHCTTNPAFVTAPDGRCMLFYKSWNTAEYNAAKGTVRGNRKYGLAIAQSFNGPYQKYEGNPVIDFSSRGDNRQFEDAFVWREEGRYKMLARDMGIYSHEAGLYLESSDGIHWSDPLIAYNALSTYIQEPPAPSHLKRYGRLERPQLLLKDGKPAYLFTASQGGRYMTASAFIFKIEA